jgi:hypothetical protein
MSGFQKTVDLKGKMKKNEQNMGQARSRIRAQVIQKTEETLAKKKRSSRAQAIDQVYSEVDDNVQNSEFHHIERAKERLISAELYKLFTIILSLVLVGTIIYFIYFLSDNNSENKNQSKQEARWYAVELVNGETYYGEVTNTSADPVIINNVYYNYDQLNADKGEVNKNESGNLRLIKRGKETHGPAGEMSIVRAQVLFMEPLKDDSLVLKAILDYEK